MSLQRLNVFLEGGSGTVTLAPEPGASGMYETGDAVSISLEPGPGFSLVEWTIDGTQVSTNSPLIVNIGRSDIVVVGVLSGEILPSFDYGVRLTSKFVSITDKEARLILEEKDYTGSVLEAIAESVFYNIGKGDASPVETFVTSDLRWNYVIEKNNIDLDFLLTSDPRRFRVTYYRGYIDDNTYDFKWVGYLKPSFIERPEYKTTYKIGLTATDGLSDLKAYKSTIAAVDYTDAVSIIASLLKQSYRDPLPIKTSVRVFEERMDSTVNNQSPFLQYYLNEDFLYADETRFQAEGSQVVFNPSKNILEALESIVKSFVTRVFQWNAVWYVVRVFEYAKDTIRIANFNSDGDFLFSETILNNQTFPCIGNPRRRGQDDYTEFNVALNLGSINRPETRVIIEDDFGNLSWYNSNPGRPSTDVNTGNTLRRWLYKNATEFDGQRESETARVEHVSNPTSGAFGQFPRFWGTADGIDDSDISGISWRVIEYGSAVKNANVLTLSVDFQVLRRGSGDRSVPLQGSHVAALEVKIGDNYLEWDGSTNFTWTLTPTKIEIPIENALVFNTLQIPGVVVPEDGSVELTLFQLVTISGTRHRYIIDWDNVNVSLEVNDALTYTKVEGKSITDEQYSNKYPTFEIFTGDALTNLSSSAMILKDVADNPVTETWQREGETESEPLIGLVLQDLQNIFGKNNYTISANILEREDGPLDFTKAIIYKGKKYIVLNASLNARTEEWALQFYQLN